MKKTLFALVCCALVLGSAAAVQAADCPGPAAAAPVSTDAPAPAELNAPLDPAELLAAGLISSTEIRVSDFDFEICNWWACEQTPTGCGCAGFYCNGQFICGYRIK